MMIAVKTMKQFKKEFKEEIESLKLTQAECMLFFKAMMVTRKMKGVKIK